MRTEPITAIIVDDEVESVQTLDALVKTCCPDIKIIGRAVGHAEGYNLISNTDPHVVFLDIEMPGKDGLSLIEEFGHRNFYVVFYTAFSHYAIPAIKAGAFDYMMKPVDCDEICTVVSRIKRAIRRAVDIREEKETNKERFTIRTGNDTRVIMFSDIVRVHADGSYSMIHMKNGEKIMVSKNLKKMEGLLPEESFIRVHNSFIVNAFEVDIWRFPENRCLMSDGTAITLSSRRRERIKEMLTAS